MLRRIAFIGLGLVALMVGGIVAAFLLVDRFDLAPFAARRASAALGRPVTIAGLHVTPGQWITVDLDGVRLDNVAGGTRPAMVELGHLTVEIEAASLLHRPPVVRRLAIDRLSVLLERTADHTANWKFGPAKPPKDGAAGRASVPTLLDARIKDSEITFRTSSGNALRTRLDDVAIVTGGVDQPVRLTAAGAYNDVPVQLEGDLQSIAALRDVAVPYGMILHMASGDTTLDFKGTMTDPLNADGAKGALALNAPTPGPILAMAGAGSPGDKGVSLALEGTAERTGDLWRLTDGSGAVGHSKITAATLRLKEGASGKPDDVAADIAFDQLNLNEVLASEGQGSGSDVDVPLAIARAPDPLLDAHVSARQLTYAGLRAADVRLAASMVPGRVAVDELSMTTMGGRFRASGAIEPADRGGRVSANLAVSGADLGAVRGLMGFGVLPITGALDGQLAMASTGTTLNGAARAASVSAVMALSGGGISRNVIEMASTDVRRLFRKPKGMSPIVCSLGVLQMRAGAGTLLPVRVRAADGTIVGKAQFDLYRRWLDLTIGSQSSTTSFFALDIPIRVSGAFANPTVRPARWSAAGRAMLAAPEDVSRLPPALQQAARRNPCLGPR